MKTIDPNKGSLCLQSFSKTQGTLASCEGLFQVEDVVISLFYLRGFIEITESFGGKFMTGKEFHSNVETYCSYTRGPGNELRKRNEKNMNFALENAQYKRKHKYVDEQI